LLKFLFLFFICFQLYAQDNNTAISINEFKISVDEFSTRLNNLPQKSRTSIADVKEDLICSLIAEAILADQVNPEQLASHEKISLLTEQYHNEALYELWMESEIRNKIRIDESELQKSFKHFREQKILEFWTFNNKESAAKTRLKLNGGGIPGMDPQNKILDFGESLPEVEEAVFYLNPGELSHPVLIDSTYYLFRLKNTITHPYHSKYDYNYWKPSLEKIIRQRKEKKILDEQLHELMKYKEFTIDGTAFNFLHDQLYPFIYSNSNTNTSSPELIQLEIGSNFNKHENSFDKVLIYFNNGNQWTVRDFWKKLAVSPYPLNYKNPYDLKPGLKDVIQRTILLETLAQNARSKGYNKTGYVQNESQMWTRNILASAYIEAQRCAVNLSESELITYYDSNKNSFIKPDLYNIVPLIVKEKSLADELYSQIINGSDIIPLSEKYSINKLGLDSSNPGIYITKDAWGPIGSALSGMRIGQVSSPLKLNDGNYALIKLLEIKNSVLYTYNEIRDKIVFILTEKKIQNAVSEYLQKVVNSYNIKINRNLIDNVEYYGGDVVVKKTHFPLRNMAPGFPVFNHRSKWYQNITK